MSNWNDPRNARPSATASFDRDGIPDTRLRRRRPGPDGLSPNAGVRPRVRVSTFPNPPAVCRRRSCIPHAPWKLSHLHGYERSDHHANRYGPNKPQRISLLETPDRRRMVQPPLRLTPVNVAPRIIVVQGGRFLFFAHLTTPLIARILIGPT